MLPVIVTALLTSQAALEPARPPLPPSPPRQVLPKKAPPAPPPPPDRSRVARPRGNPGTWVTMNDYPSRALRYEQAGRTAFRVIVNSAGRVTHCEIRESSGWPVLDQAACSNIKRRGRFLPAINTNGTPVEGSWSSAVAWRIPDSDVIELREGTAFQSYVVEASGAMSDCQKLSGMGVVTIMPGMSADCNAMTFIEPYRDATGQPVRRKVTITTRTSISHVD